MKYQTMMALTLGLLISGSTAQAIDRVKTVDKGTVSCKIQSINPREVTIELNSGQTETIAANEVVSITFDGEPSKLPAARNAAESGRYEDAFEMFNELLEEAKGNTNPHVELDVLWYQAFCSTQMALSGQGDVAAAGRLMNNFVKQGANSYHFFQATEMLGDLLLAVEKYDLAVDSYEKLSLAPWVDYKMRGHVAKGRALRGKKDFSSALTEYEAALALAGEEENPLVASQKLSAQLGKASCMAEDNRTDEAIKLVEEVILNADPEDVHLHAMAYNTLGNAYRKAGRTKDALHSFLHVDVLYFADGAAHAEALKNLGELWLEVEEPDRAVEAQQILKQRYKNSPWAN